MKSLYFSILLSLLVLPIVAGCEDGGEENVVPDDFGGNEGFVVFLGQTHITRANDEDSKLVGNRDTIIKVNISSSKNSALASVNARLSLNGETETIKLDPPKKGLKAISLAPGKIQHSFDDSFTAVITKDWIKPGLIIAVDGGDKTANFDALKIGAPNKIIMTMIDAHFFKETEGDYPDGWRRVFRPLH